MPTLNYFYFRKLTSHQNPKKKTPKFTKLHKPQPPKKTKRQIRIGNGSRANPGSTQLNYFNKIRDLSAIITPYVTDGMGVTDRPE